MAASVSLRVGAGCRSDDPSAFHAYAQLCRDGVLDHVQVLVIPEPAARFRSRCEFFGSCDVPVVVHAPYHIHGVNPCEPSCSVPSPLGEPESLIPFAMAQTSEIADITRSPWIVFHPGAVRAGGFDGAAASLRDFFDRWSDSRVLVENLPARSHGWEFIGATPGEIRQLTDGGKTGICLDFSHLACTAVLHNVPFDHLLAGFKELPVRFQHISGKQACTSEDEHLPLNHPLSDLPWAEIGPWLREHACIATSIEYKGNDIPGMAGQVQYFHDRSGG